jgi:hypothetical protein
MAALFQRNIFQNNIFQGETVVVVTPAASTGGAGGGGRTAKVDRWDAAELEGIYDRILGIEEPSKPVKAAIKAVERVAREVQPKPETVDWDAVAADVKAVKALLRAYEDYLDEQDVEDAIRALLPILDEAA